MSEERAEGRCVVCKDIKTRDWYPWNNLMPPPPDDFHVVGEVYVPNPGVDVCSHPRSHRESIRRSYSWTSFCVKARDLDTDVCMESRAL